MNSQNPNPNQNLTFLSAPPGFPAPILDLNQEPYDEQPQLNINHQIQNNVVYDPNSRIIVRAPNASQNNDNNAPTSEATEQRLQRRVKELVRVSDLDLPDRRKFRETVRRIRMVYDSIHVMAMVEEDNDVDIHQERSNLRAFTMMKNHGLWLNRDNKIVGAIPGVSIGDVFLNKLELVVVGLHGQPQADIDYSPGIVSSNGERVATSVIVSGGYEDGVDQGDIIIYSCHGGQDNNSRQVFNQKLEGGNLAMERSMHYGIEVRVIRSVQFEGTSSASNKLFVYDGVYRIVDCLFDVGDCKFKLWRVDGQAKMGSLILKEPVILRSNPLFYKPEFVLAFDISNGKEKVGVRLFNDIDRNMDPMGFEYIPGATFLPFVAHQSEGMMGCECIGECVEGCYCFMKNGNECPYTQSGILLKGRPLLFECGPFCSCPPNCRNRVTQKGLQHRLEVFRSRETGWGVRSLDLIQAGTFICEYIGVVLTREQAQICTMNGDSLIYPSRFAESWAEWGNLSLIDANYKRLSYPLIPPLDFAMDVSSMRSVACYISHSSTPNVMVQFVLYDHNNLMFPHLMLFAIENIPPLREFSLDYGVVEDDLN